MNRFAALALTLAVALPLGCAHTTSQSEAVRPPQRARGLIEEPRRAALAAAVRSEFAKARGFDAAQVELAIRVGKESGRDADRGLAQRVLARTFRLIDPVWGGAREIADRTSGRAFFKTASTQAELMRLYAIGWETWRGASYLKAARDVDRYVKGYLTSPEGAFYTAQGSTADESGELFLSLDDNDRRSFGLPRVDQRVVSLDNAQLIDAMVRLYQVTSDQEVLDRAKTAAHWVLNHRRVEGGGIAHEDVAQGAAPSDTLAMGLACAELYRVTNEPEWLDQAEDSVAFAASAKAELSSGELASLARLAGAVHRQTGDGSLQEIAAEALRQALSSADAATIARVLLADLELGSPPASRLSVPERTMLARQ